MRSLASSTFGEVPARRSSRLPSSWPLCVVFVAQPLWWVLGAGYFSWPLLTFACIGPLLLRRRVTVPPGFTVWLLFLVWMALSAVPLGGSEVTPGFFWRASVYVSATLTFLFVFNTPRRALSDGAVIAVLTVFWLEVIVAGFLGVAFPGFSFHTVLETMVPASWSPSGHLDKMLHPGLSEVMTFLGYPVGRPKALFAYSNHWGAAVAVLTPFAIAAFACLKWRLARGALAAALLLSLVPIIVSLNRGVWLALGVGLTYGALRVGRLARRARSPTIAFLAVAILLVAATPLGSLVAARVSSPSHSTTTRLAVYRKTAAAVGDSPILGHGSPRTRAGDRGRRTPGTQGQLSLVVYSHGIPGLLLFVGWFGYSLVRCRHRRSSAPLAAHVALLVGIVEMPFYILLPTTLHALMLGSALAWRDVAEIGAGERADGARRRPVRPRVVSARAEIRPPGSSADRGALT